MTAPNQPRPADEAIPEGAVVRVRVPASSGNVGPGYDTLGLALGLYDDLTVERIGAGLEFDLAGEGIAEVPRTEEHLVVRALRALWDRAGLTGLPGLRLGARLRIPHSRGLGSSASAIVAGVVAANALLPEELRLPETELLQVCARMEGHPDNVAPSLFGGLAISWEEDAAFRTVSLAVAEGVVPVVAVPDYQVPTRVARGLIPASIPHAEAAANSGRAALLVHALSQEPDLLYPATQDLLHQRYRVEAMAPSGTLLDGLRRRGLPAIVSGAGPTVLVLAESPARAEEAQQTIRELVSGPRALPDAAGVSWSVQGLTPDAHGVTVTG